MLKKEMSTARRAALESGRILNELYGNISRISKNRKGDLKMKALYFNGKDAELRTDYPMPEPKEGESLIRVLQSGVCNTDKEILKGYVPGFDGVMGHEFVGVVEKSVDAGLTGKRVVGEINLNCGKCMYCLTQRPRHCMNRTVLGIREKDGCFAEYLTLPDRLLHIVPDIISTETAVLTEPLAAALEITSRVHIDPEKNIAVLGDGRLGLMIAQVLSLTGAELTVIGRHEEKLELFRPYATVLSAPKGSYEYVVDATGSPSGLPLAYSLVRKGGTIIVKSTYAGNVEINMSAMVVDEITITGSRCGDFTPALNLLMRGLIKLPPVEPHPIEEYLNAFNSKAFKAVFRISGH